MKFLATLSCFIFSATLSAQVSTDFIQGSWELKSYVPDGLSDWEEYGDHIVYQKHISGDYFAWIRYNTETNKLEGMGGGSFYMDDEGRYVEHLDFFYPPGSNELGQSIPFSVEFKGKNWLHTGYAKVMDVNLAGSNEVVDSIKIEEIWKPIKPSNKSGDLVGAWELVKYRDNPEIGYLVYPEIVGYMKIITGSHFIWVKYDQEGDQIFGTGCGTYSRSDDLYSENIEIIYPDPNLLGKTIDFDCNLDGFLWKHYGQVQNEDGSKEAIDEYWSPKYLAGDN